MCCIQRYDLRDRVSLSYLDVIWVHLHRPPGWPRAAVDPWKVASSD